MTFTSTTLERLRSLRAQSATSLPVEAVTADTPPAILEEPIGRVHARPNWERLRLTRGHCGSCRHFSELPRPYAGLCALGRALHWPWEASREPVEVHPGSPCGIAAGSRWVRRAGVKVWPAG